ncbi:hypothetical protein AK812_SmicGene14017 [Symbiodinium microadriaticum]|uniref:Uncharacterized protein n=1 Tax=Symbiodinium microadriaticum TaxID=2951 RepID=A0A1Q9E6N9_SYMMI|nr:hypothetical protein AK812_SmicGene14017 [Symbiodinium microadriaticum]
MAFPLLIFNTIATAELGSLDLGVIGACSLAKVLVLGITWLLTYCAFRPERSHGQRILTSSVFAFFAIASDDFAIGFPVIDALYGKVLNMGIYIAGNALVGSFVFVPVTMAALAVGGVLKKSEAEGSKKASTWQITRNYNGDYRCTPVQERVSLGGVKRVRGLLRDFTFFYGAIPTGSPPIVFAGLYDPDSSELVATAVLLGLVLAGPIMFVTSVLLNSDAESSAHKVLNDVQLSADAASLVCGALLAVSLIIVRRFWSCVCPVKTLLACYALVLIVYNSLSLLFEIPELQKENCPTVDELGQRSALVVCFGWSQHTASILLLVLQLALVKDSVFAGRRPAFNILPPLLCALLALAPAFLAAPNTLYEICRYEESGPLTVANMVWSCLKLAVCIGLSVRGILGSGGNGPPDTSLPSSEVLRVGPLETLQRPVVQSAGGVLRVLTTMNILKVLTQVVNASQVYFKNRRTSGSFAAMLVLESVISHGQAVVLLASLLFDSQFTSLHLDFCCPCLRRLTTWSTGARESMNPFSLTAANLPSSEAQEA